VNDGEFFEAIQVVEHAKNAGHVIAKYADAAIARVAEVAAKALGRMAVIEYKFIVFRLGFLTDAAACPFRGGEGDAGILGYFFCNRVPLSGGLGTLAAFRSTKPKSVSIEGVSAAGVAVVLVERFLHFALGTGLGRHGCVQGILLLGGGVLGLVRMLAVVVVFGSAESHRKILRGVRESPSQHVVRYINQE